MKAVCVALLAGVIGCACAPPASAADAGKAKEKVLYSFCNQQNCADGQGPTASLIDVKGTLYGTTEYGGRGCGTVFALDSKTGKETVLHSFGSGTDGQNPFGNLIDANGTLYGTTFAGGAYGGGAVFAIDPKSGAETVLYSFCSQQYCADGANPLAGVVSVNGTLYGTTTDGGTNNDGTIFALDPDSGAETALHSFGSGTDGQAPFAGLHDVQGTLYGTTLVGGTYGAGTVFAFDLTTNTETVLHVFGSGTDGQQPKASLIDVKGLLYGTTSEGGTDGNGTVFALDPRTGTETLLYAFGANGDGQEPGAALINVKDTLYGTTYSGGATFGGTVFAFDRKAAKEKVLYSFCRRQNCTDGQYLSGDLIAVQGTLYGTTTQGGAHNEGTVFAIKP